MKKYLQQGDILYHIGRFLPGSDIISLLKAIPDIRVGCDVLRIHEPIDLRNGEEFLKACTFPIFTNVQIADWPLETTAKQWSCLFNSLGAVVQQLEIFSLTRPDIKLWKLNRLKTLRVSMARTLQPLYGLECGRLHKLSIEFCSVIGVRFASMPFFEHLHTLELQECEIYDLVDVLPRMKKLRSLHYRIDIFMVDSYRQDIFRVILSQCPQLTSLALTHSHDFLRLDNLEVNLGQLEYLAVQDVFEHAKYLPKETRSYCIDLARIFGQANCPRLKTLSYNVLLSFLDDEDTRSYPALNQPLIFELSEQFPHLETLMLPNSHALNLFNSFEIATKDRIPRNKIKNVHLGYISGFYSVIFPGIARTFPYAENIYIDSVGLIV